MTNDSMRHIAVARTNLIVACLITLSLSGCKSMTNWTDKLPWSSQQSKITESAYQTPARMATIWVPDVMTLPNGESNRGFGGRFFFYDQMNSAIPVEGQLVVYAYDDTNKLETTRTPTRKYVFTPEQFTTHFSESRLGASYSIWISWDAVGGEEQSISLMPVFTTTSGHVVMGQQALNVLPGKKTKEVPAVSPIRTFGMTRPQMTGDAQTSSGVVGAGYQNLASDERTAQAAGRQIVLRDADQRTIRTTTIKLPNSLKARLNERRLQHRLGTRSHVESGVQRASLETRSVAQPLSSGGQPLSRRGVATHQAAVDLANSMAASARPAGLRSALPTAHFGHPQYPAQALPNGQQAAELEPNQPNPSARRSALPFSRQRTSTPSIPVTWSNAARTRG
jgi:hypothetical protein